VTVFGLRKNGGGGGGLADERKRVRRVTSVSHGSIVDAVETDGRMCCRLATTTTARDRNPHTAMGLQLCTQLCSRLDYSGLAGPLDRIVVVITIAHAKRKSTFLTRSARLGSVLVKRQCKFGIIFSNLRTRALLL
jgi:hypothetical protein